MRNADKSHVVQMFLRGALLADVATRYGVHHLTIECVLREALLGFVGLNQSLASNAARASVVTTASFTEESEI